MWFWFDLWFWWVYLVHRVLWFGFASGWLWVYVVVGCLAGVFGCALGVLAPVGFGFEVAFSWFWTCLFGGLLWVGFGHFGVLLRLCCVLGLLDSGSLGFVGVA